MTVLAWFMAIGWAALGIVVLFQYNTHEAWPVLQLSVLWAILARLGEGR